MKSMFEMEIKFGFGDFTDQETVWIEAENESKARTFAEDVIMDRQEEWGSVLSAKIINPDDLPEGETFWTAA